MQMAYASGAAVVRVNTAVVELAAWSRFHGQAGAVWAGHAIGCDERGEGCGTLVGGMLQ